MSTKCVPTMYERPFNNISVASSVNFVKTLILLISLILFTKGLRLFLPTLEQLCSGGKEREREYRSKK